MALKDIIRNNTAATAILIYIIIFMIIQYMNPSIIYNRDGSLREFGIGYSSKTVLPIWLVAIIIAILSYLAVIIYVRPSSRMVML
jgi:hypothetical protein